MTQITDVANQAQWWVKNRDRVLLGAFVLMFLAALGFIPSPVSRGVDQLIEEHAGIERKLTVQCAHLAKNDREVGECITGVLSGRP